MSREQKRVLFKKKNLISYQIFLLGRIRLGLQKIHMSGPRFMLLATDIWTQMAPRQNVDMQLKNTCMHIFFIICQKKRLTVVATLLYCPWCPSCKHQREPQWIHRTWIRDILFQLLLFFFFSYLKWSAILSNTIKPICVLLWRRLEQIDDISPEGDDFRSVCLKSRKELDGCLKATALVQKNTFHDASPSIKHV